MKKFLHIFLMLTFALPTFAQFDDLGVTVSADGTLTFPSAATFRLKNDIASTSDIPVLKTLLFGTGLNGISYNGGAEVTTSVNTSWLTANYHNALTCGTGLLGDNYNGTAMATWSIDASYIKGLMPTLTRGTGLTGSNYNGNTAATFAVDTSWLMTNYHKYLTAGDGLKFESGTVYNGQLERTAVVDKANILAWINGLKRDFRVVVDMSPTPQHNAVQILNTNQTNPFYSLNRTWSLTAENASTTNMARFTNGITTDTVLTDATLTTLTNTTYTIKSISASFERLTDASGSTLSTYKTRDYTWDIRWWTDCEIKVLDKWGNIIYWTSTICRDSNTMATNHPEVADTTCSIWVYSNYEYQNGGCVSRKFQFENAGTESIGGTISYFYYVSSVEIYPSFSSTATRTVPNWTGYQTQSGTKSVVWGAYIRDIFANPENTIVAWRQTTDVGEMFEGDYTVKLWRRALVEFYGDFKN